MPYLMGETIEEKRKEIIQRQKEMLDISEAEKREFYEDETWTWAKLEGVWEGLELYEEQERSGGPVGRFLDPNDRGIEYRTSFKRGEIREYRPDDLKQMVESRSHQKPDRALQSYRNYLKLGPYGVGPEAQTRDLQMDLANSGGWAVTPYELAQEYLVDLNSATFMRQLCRLYEMPYAETLRIADVIGPASPTWGEELSIGATDSTMSMTGRDWTPHPAGLLLKVSKKLIRARTDLENLVREETSRVMAELLETGFLQGDGVNKPLGLFVASELGVGTGRDVETSATATVKGDDLHSAIKALKRQYRRGARWIASREFEYRVSVLKSGDGQYLFQPSLEKGVPGTLLGYPLEVSDFAPDTWTSGSYVAMLGNPRFYLICDAMSGFQIQVLVEKYADTNQNGYTIRMETDGNVTDPNAWVRLKLK